MNTIAITQYSKDCKSDWDRLISQSKNGHFMHYRDYIDYHEDRFTDCSLILYDYKHNIEAVFPANINNGIVYSHQGLTFGGLILSSQATMASVFRCFDAIGLFLKQNFQATEVLYKRIPDFYNKYPSQEDLYALYRLNATIIRRDISSLISLDNRLSYSKGRKWSINKAKKMGFAIEEVKNITQFWQLLTAVLDERHETKPVHTEQEMNLLMSKFPNNIRCFVAKGKGSSIVSGALIYETAHVVHTQYLANSKLGREVGALDYLIDFLISNIFNYKKYFDFGISTQSEGRILNDGLISYKEGFGARGFAHDFYKWDLRRF